MPIEKVGSRYRWGAKGKLYAQKSRAAVQGRAISAARTRQRKVQALFADWAKLDAMIQKNRDPRNLKGLIANRTRVALEILRLETKVKRYG